MRKSWTTPSGEIYSIYQSMLNEPHLMIAGATGSGKSVVINALIYTILYRFPDCVENKSKSASMILLDPKRVELVQYKDLPHTLRYASEPAEMVRALQYAMSLTEDRYRTMQRQGVRKWDGGQIYVCIDEFADLMTTNKKQVQPLIQRLAQVGRAAGVHIILATQCPLAKVIPTEIKVNFDARIGLRTRSEQDSRNILGETGCELLPRYGQGYYMTPEGMSRYNIPMIPEEELDDRVQWWMGQKPRGFFSRLFGWCA